MWYGAGMANKRLAGRLFVKPVGGLNPNEGVVVVARRLQCPTCRWWEWVAIIVGLVVLVAWTSPGAGGAVERPKQVPMRLIADRMVKLSSPDAVARGFLSVSARCWDTSEADQASECVVAYGSDQAAEGHVVLVQTAQQPCRHEYLDKHLVGCFSFPRFHTSFIVSGFDPWIP